MIIFIHNNANLSTNIITLTKFWSRWKKWLDRDSNQGPPLFRSYSKNFLTSYFMGIYQASIDLLISALLTENLNFYSVKWFINFEYIIMGSLWNALLDVKRHKIVLNVNKTDIWKSDVNKHVTLPKKIEKFLHKKSGSIFSISSIQCLRNKINL